MFSQQMVLKMSTYMSWRDRAVCRPDKRSEELQAVRCQALCSTHPGRLDGLKNDSVRMSSQYGTHVS